MKLRLGIVSLCGLVGLLVACGPSKKELQADLDATRGQLEQSQTENKSLKQKIAELESDLDTFKSQIAELNNAGQLTAEELARLREEQRRREAELDTYKNLFAKLKKLVDAGTIKVSFRKGKLIVELASAVLFDSGKTDLKPEGQTALQELVVAFQSVGDRDFLVAGHTDNIPIKGSKRFKSNWELSAQRAIEVVNFMIDKGFPAEHIGAAGYSSNDPVATNDSEDGRAQNRRIEIILMPNLGELKGIREILEGGGANKKKES